MTEKTPWFTIALISLLLGSPLPGILLPNNRSHAQEVALDETLPMLRQQNVGHLGAILQSSAMQHMQNGNLDVAMERIEEAIDHAIKADSADSLPVMILLQILNKRDDEAAYDYLQQLLQKTKGKPAFQIKIYDQFGYHFRMRGELVKAISSYQSQIDLMAEFPGNPAKEIATLRAFGQTCLQAQMPDLAMPALKRCQKLAVENSDLLTANLCDGDIGNAALAAGLFDIAAQRFQRQLETSLKARKTAPQDPGFSMALNGLVTTSVQTGDLDAAAKWIATAKAPPAGDKLSSMEIGMYEGYETAISLLKGDLETAVKQSDMAIKSKSNFPGAAFMPSMSLQATMLDRLSNANYHLLAGDPIRAEKMAKSTTEAFDATIKQIDSLEKQGIGSAEASRTALAFVPASISNIRQRILIEQNKIEDALLAAEAGRAQSQLANLRKNFGAKSPKTAAMSIDQIKAIAKRDNVTFVEYSIVYDLDFPTRGFLGLDHPRSQPKSIFIWVVQPSGKIEFKNVPLKESLNELITAFRADLLETDATDDHDPEAETTPESTPPKTEKEPPTDEANSDDRGNNQKPAGGPLGDESNHRLHQLLIEPIDSLLSKDPNSVVVIIPHEGLFAVPFYVLKNADGEALIDRHTISLASSIATYDASTSLGRAIQKFDISKALIVGNPTMPGYQSRPDKRAAPLSMLPGAEAEAKAIAQMFGVTALVGDEATETSVSSRLADASVIHLATHGLLESDNIYTQSYLSAIALTPSDQDDGYLTVQEVMKMKLKADLAVMSACDSGRGKITGDGVIGLSRGYLAAGVPSVMVSLWPVSDRSTAILMVNFYQGLKSGQSKAASLRSAMMKNRERFQEPKLWAPFVIYGSAN